MLSRRWLRRILVAVLFSLLTTTVWLVGQREWRRQTGERDFAAAIAETEQTDPDWRWERLSAARRQPAPGRNGAEVIRRVKENVPGGWSFTLKSPGWQQYTQPVAPNVRVSDPVIAEARRELTAVIAAVEQARSLKRYPEGHNPIDLTPDVLSTKLGHIDDTRLASDLLRWDVVLAVEDGDTTRAADSILALLHTSRSIGDEPFFISQVVRIALRFVATHSLEWALGQAEFPDPVLAGLQAAWAADAEAPLLLYGARGERATMDVLFGNLADGTLQPGELPGSHKLSFEVYAWWLYRGRFPRERADFHRWMTRLVEVSRLPIEQQPGALAVLPPPPMDDDHKLARLFIPADEKIATAHWRGVAETRCAVVGLACERYRVKHGKWPEGPNDLRVELPSGLPLDPLDGQPLRFHRLPDGVVVYSIGPDGVDNGGNISREVPSPGTDVGFRLWDPGLRRRPAPPELVPPPNPDEEPVQP